MKIVQYMKNPPQGFSEARRAGSFFWILITDPPHKEALSGGVAFIVQVGERGNNLRIIFE